MQTAKAPRLFDAVPWAMAQFHRGEKRAQAQARRDAERARQKTRQNARAQKAVARGGAL